MSDATPALSKKTVSSIVYVFLLIFLAFQFFLMVNSASRVRFIGPLLVLDGFMLAVCCLSLVHQRLTLIASAVALAIGGHSLLIFGELYNQYYKAAVILLGVLTATTCITFICNAAFRSSSETSRLGIFIKSIVVVQIVMAFALICF